MSWLRLDDGFTEHPKIVQLTPRDRWTWLRVLSYCARYRTAGRLPEGLGDVVAGASPAFLERCYQLHLLDLEPVENGAYVVHDWDEYNPPRVEEGTLEERVRQALEASPDASANELARMVGGQRKAALRLIRRFRPGTGAVPGQFPPAVPGTGYGSRPRPSSSTPKAVVLDEELPPGEPEPPAGNGERPQGESHEPEPDWRELGLPAPWEPTP